MHPGVTLDFSDQVMKKLAIVLGVLVLIAGAVGYNLWRASREPIVITPGAYEVGRQKLHAQLEQSQQQEAQIEKQDWDSVTLLHALIGAHQQRIQKLTGNSQATEILAHDSDAIARIEKRIADLEAIRAAQPPPPEPADSEQPQPPSPPKN